MGRRFASAIVGLAAVLVPLGVARAGPPYLTDDPEPTDTGHWEIYNFVIGQTGAAGFAGEAGVDLNYGAARDLQLTAVLPAALQDANGILASGLRGGPGIVELAAKYRVLHQSSGSWLPDVSVFPRLFVPTQSRFSTGHPNLLLPVWVQKDAGAWSLFGGGGYQVNPGQGQQGFWQGGIALTRALGQRFTLGAEWFGQTQTTPAALAPGGPKTSTTTGGGGYSTANFAATWRMTAHWSLLASAGPTWEEGGTHGQVFYFALKADY